MGKPKTQRTQTLIQAARRYTVAKQAIEQHHFDKLVRTGLIVEGGFEKGVTPQVAGGCCSTNVPRSINGFH